MAALEGNPSEAPPADLTEISMPATPTAPVGTPVTFPARTEEAIVCPRCGRRQRGDRDFCYACVTPFQYENE